MQEHNDFNDDEYKSARGLVFDIELLWVGLLESVIGSSIGLSCHDSKDVGAEQLFYN